MTPTFPARTTARRRSSCVNVALLASLLGVLHARALAADPYVAWLKDGTKLTGPSLSAWPLAGASFRFESHDLAAAKNPVRFIRGPRTAAALSPPYVVLANGDRLGGLPTRLAPDDGRAGQTLRVIVEPEPPLVPLSGTGLAVRTDRVQRIAVAPDSVMPQPGTAVLADGRRLAARSIRWREYGLALLTNDGIVEAAFTDLADVVFPGVDVAAAVVDDNLWASGASGTAIARIQTAGGAVVTAARVSRELEQDRRRGRLTNTTYCYTQPAWANQPLAIPEEEIVCCGYRAADEAPLSLLPATTMANSRVIGQPRPWTANRTADGGMLASADRESDIGIATHAHSAIEFELPARARSLEAAVGLDRDSGEGGCVRCKVVADGHTLWDSGVFLGAGGMRQTGRLDVAGVDRVVLVTELAHDDRPPGADPFDIRDSVVWLAPLVTLDLSDRHGRSRALAMLAGAADWQTDGDRWRNAKVASRWNVPASSWDAVLTIPENNELKLTRTISITRANDVVELLTVCPLDLDEHDFLLKVNGQTVAWHNNADRSQLRQWTLRYSRSRARDGEEMSNLTDRLAYWWDLSPWRGRQVALELTLRGHRETNEVVWRGLSLRSAIGNSADGGQPLAPDVRLTSLKPVVDAQRDRGQVLKDAIPRTREGEPIRFLGQSFAGGYGLARDSRVAFRVPQDARAFVAVVGCCQQVAGPVQVLIDDRVVWERSAISSLSPAEQIEIPIPSGAKLLSLQSGASSLYYGFAAFAEAGFLVGNATDKP